MAATNNYPSSMHPIHQVYEVINKDIAENGTPWNKCMDCGDLYIIGRDGGTTNFCSEDCERKTMNYLNTGNLEQD